MRLSISAEQLFEQLSERLQLAWLAGEGGKGRTVDADKTHLRPSLAGFLNLVHPNNLQILGSEELRYLDALDARKRWETVAEMLSQEPTAVIVTDGLTAPDDIIESAKENGTPLWTSPLVGVEMVSHLQHFLSLTLAKTTTLHGVFMEVFSLGVLIIGESGSGKSELALELITRGHRLIADDAPRMTRIGPDVVDGSCPELLEDCLEVRGLGILNVRAMFGDSAVKSSKYLNLIVHLKMQDAESIRKEPLDRLHGDVHQESVLGVVIPMITIPVAPGRNIAVILEAAVRNHNLKLKGFDAAEAFLRRHRAEMDRQDGDESKIEPVANDWLSGSGEERGGGD